MTNGDARRLVNEQAEDEGLWGPAATAMEAYVQAALRELHAAVERDTGVETGPLANRRAATPSNYATRQLGEPWSVAAGIVDALRQKAAEAPTMPLAEALKYVYGGASPDAPAETRETIDCVETLRSTIKDGAWTDLSEQAAAWYVNHLGRALDILRRGSAPAGAPRGELIRRLKLRVDRLAAIAEVQPDSYFRAECDRIQDSLDALRAGSASPAEECANCRTIAWLIGNEPEAERINDSLAARVSAVINRLKESRAAPPAAPGGERHPVADAFGFAKEYAEAAGLVLPASTIVDHDTVIVDVKAGDRARQLITQVGGRIVARVEIVRAWDQQAIAECDRLASPPHKGLTSP